MFLFVFIYCHILDHKDSFWLVNTIFLISYDLLVYNYEKLYLSLPKSFVLNIMKFEVQKNCFSVTPGEKGKSLNYFRFCVLKWYSPYYRGRHIRTCTVNILPKVNLLIFDSLLDLELSPSFPKVLTSLYAQPSISLWWIKTSN